MDVNCALHVLQISSTQNWKNQHLKQCGSALRKKSIIKKGDKREKILTKKDKQDKEGHTK